VILTCVRDIYSSYLFSVAVAADGSGGTSPLAAGVDAESEEEECAVEEEKHKGAAPGDRGAVHGERVNVFVSA
jgi:hypothetical protein